jgi:hypothetical protein
MGGGHEVKSLAESGAMKSTFLLFLFFLIYLANQATATGGEDQKTTKDESTVRLSELTAQSDEEIRDYVQNHKNEKITEIKLNIAWDKCSAKGFSYLIELKNLEIITLVGNTSEPYTERNGNFYFKAIATPDSFVEQISAIKGLKSVQVWYGCLLENQKQILRKKLSTCSISEHLNKI